ALSAETDRSIDLRGDENCARSRSARYGRTDRDVAERGTAEPYRPEKAGRRPEPEPFPRCRAVDREVGPAVAVVVGRHRTVAERRRPELERAAQPFARAEDEPLPRGLPIDGQIGRAIAIVIGGLRK